MVLRVMPTLTRFPTNSIYTPCILYQLCAARWAKNRRQNKKYVFTKPSPVVPTDRLSIGFRKTE